MILKPNRDIQKVIVAFVITTGISLVLAVGILLLTDLYPSRPYTSDSFVVLWFFGFLAIIFGLIAGTYQYNKLKKESGISVEKLSDEEELEIQVENYNNLGITKSNKGQATLFLGVVIIFSIALGIFDVTPLSDVLYSLIIYIPLTFFIYKGHRWAMYLGIILWTLEKGYQLFYSSHGKGSVIIVGIILFAFFYFFKDEELSSVSSGSQKTYKGYECTDDCSGHEAGYEWAQRKGITDPDDCGGNSNSFIEGCKSYVGE